MKRLTALLSLVLFIALALGGGYFYYSVLPEKIEQKVIFGISGFNVEKLVINKIEKKSGKVVLSGISLDKDGFSTIERIEVTFAPMQLILNSERSLNLDVYGMNLTGSLNADDMSVSIDGFKSASSFLAALNQSSVSSISIENGSLNLLSEQLGGVKVDVKGILNSLGESGYELHGVATAKQKNLTFTAKLNGTTPKPGMFTLNAQADQFSFETKETRVNRGVVRANLNISERLPTELNLEGELASLTYQKLPLRDMKFKIDQSNTKPFNSSFEGQVYGTQNIEWNAQIEEHDDSDNLLHTVYIRPTNIDELITFLRNNKRLSPSTNFPNLIKQSENPELVLRFTAENAEEKAIKPPNIKGDLELTFPFDGLMVSGTFATEENTQSLSGSFSMDHGRLYLNNAAQGEQSDAVPLSYIEPKASGTFKVHNFEENADLDWEGNLQITDGALYHGGFETGKITGDIGYNSKTDKYTAPFLKYSLPLADNIRHRGKISLNLNDTASPLLQSQSLEVYGGRIYTEAPISDNSGSLRKSNKLVVSDINLTWLFEDAGFRKVTIWGKLGGLIPYTLDGNKIKVEGAILQSLSSGILKLPDSIIFSLFPGNSEKIKSIRAALKNYHYEYFEIRLDGDISDRVLMTLNASGYNPDISKDPVSMNLQIETQISLLFKNLLKKE